MLQDGNTSCEYLLRASLFDSAYKQFFGRTWVGPPQRATVTGQKIKLNYNQVQEHNAMTLSVGFDSIVLRAGARV